MSEKTPLKNQKYNAHIQRHIRRYQMLVSAYSQPTHQQSAVQQREFSQEKGR